MIIFELCVVMTALIVQSLYIGLSKGVITTELAVQGMGRTVSVRLLSLFLS
jgi:hypothetical protein